MQNTEKSSKSHGVEGKNIPPSVRTVEEDQFHGAPGLVDVGQILLMLWN